MQALISLIRLPNLLIVVLTQYLLYYRVLAPAFEEAGIERGLNDHAFGIFVIITVLITASGYIINDLLDYPTDMINKPDKVIVRRQIASSTAYWLYFSFNLLGYVFALYLAFLIQYLPYLSLFPAAVTGLYIYSHILKRRPLWGNLLISFYCAAVAAILLLAEKGSLQTLYQHDPDAVIRIQALFSWYIVFAFFATLYRELIKDLQDEPGDRKTGMRTAPVVWGQGPARILTFAIGLCLLLFIAAWSLVYQSQFSIYAWLMLGLGISLPLIYTLARLWKTSLARQFHHLSQVTKWLILAGILLLLAL